MLIAMPKEGSMVCQHFGHCEQFAMYDTDTKQWILVDSPGHVPGALPEFLKKQGVQVVISGGMGAKAQQLFAAEGIQVIVGVNGKLEDVIAGFLNDELVSTGEVCSEHAHAVDCHS
ncbi:MAG: NifB/NifX family molybdenum-iron cluster-binding protein [Syntrophomonadaceae bacterium]|jgi:predicted Fe-Mo cluster-binding NifX family protein|nr:NifB/NifX family molybdenum-iron cluster-binding protein [Bacillota bacterium]NLP22915.1 dinitrogenase iron-molybdenum cofactor [Syntrophomonadaceae bacterium]